MRPLISRPWSWLNRIGSSTEFCTTPAEFTIIACPVVVDCNLAPPPARSGDLELDQICLAQISVAVLDIAMGLQASLHLLG